MGAIAGTVEAGFEAVREAFSSNFERHGEVGAAVAVHVSGRKVVDLWGGTADASTGRPWSEDTLQLVFSTTKGATAVCANLLAQRGLLDIDAPVTAYWPEFGREGKESIPVRWLLCHRAGLPVVDKRLSLDEILAWDPVVDALAAQVPMWDPGTAHGYHALTYGWLVGEVVRRITGKSLGAFFAQEVAAPLGLEFWIGLPPEYEPRVAPLVGALTPESPELDALDPALREIAEQFLGPESSLIRALTLNSAFGEGSWNERRFHAAEVPAANGITDARSLSRLYAGLIGDLPEGPSRLLTPAQVDAARETQSSGPDRILFVDTRFGLGFMLASPFSPYGGAGAFGHAGAGGSVGFADPDHGIAFGYVMNRMQQNLSGDPRTRSLIKATYEAVGAPIAFI
jgi:CubicO group peptidase (beta-lactamase class C family)